MLRLAPDTDALIECNEAIRLIEMSMGWRRAAAPYRTDAGRIVQSAQSAHPRIAIKSLDGLGGFGGGRAAHMPTDIANAP